MAEFKLQSHHIPSPADHPPEGQRRFKLVVEYDGTAYSGWQRQINGPSVQQTLEEALSRLTGEKIAVQAVELAQKLREKGFDIPEGIYQMDEVRAAVEAAIGKGGRHA